MSSNLCFVSRWGGLASALVLLGGTLATSLCTFGQDNRSAVPDRVRGRLVVQHRSAANRNSDEVLFRTHGAKIADRIERLHISILELPEPALDQVARSLNESGKFTFVEQDFTGRGAIVPNDPSFVSQWHLTKVEAPA